MKTRIFAIIALVAICIFSMASCDILEGLIPADECEHTFSEKWSSNAKEHWHAATCEHGEVRDSLADHVDEAEDGICDVCGYEIGHEHTFADSWTVDDERHWKEATCSHTDVKGEESLHADDNTDGVCDVCAAHVHIVDGAGFCSGCNTVVRPVDKNDLGSVISATTVRGYHVNGGKVEYDLITYNRTDAPEGEEFLIVEDWHDVEFVIGTNGTYSKRSEDEIISHGGWSDGYAEYTGNILVLEKWIPIFSGENVVGVSAYSVNGVYTDAQPATFGEGDLQGYYYSLSTFVDGYSADELLNKLYELATGENVSELEISGDAENNAFEFSFNVFIVGTTKLTDGSIVHNVNYYEVACEFTYTDDFTVKTLDITLDCYTSDPGKGNTKSYEADIDLDYDPDTNTMTLRDTAKGDRYTLSVNHEIGEREVVEINDGSEFLPTDFELYADETKATVVTGTTLEIKTGEKEHQFYIGTSGGFIAFLRGQISTKVTNAAGEEVQGLTATVVGDYVQIYATKKGEYVVTVTTLGEDKTLNVSVDEDVIEGEFSFEITATEQYSWENTYTFTADKSGKYTFHFPGTVGLMVNEDQPPVYDPQLVWGSDLYPYSYEVNLRAGQTFTFFFLVTDASAPYTINYDYTAPNASNT